MIDAAKGLTRSEAENAYSLSLVRHGTLKAETLWEIADAYHRHAAIDSHLLFEINSISCSVQ